MPERSLEQYHSPTFFLTFTFSYAECCYLLLHVVAIISREKCMKINFSRSSAKRFNSFFLIFFAARRYASAVYAVVVSVCLSVCLSVTL